VSRLARDLLLLAGLFLACAAGLSFAGYEVPAGILLIAAGLTAGWAAAGMRAGRRNARLRYERGEMAVSTYELSQRQVRAWDRAEGRSVIVHRADWGAGYAVPSADVQVSSPDDTEHWYTPRSALDFRYFCEPPDATPAVRQQWARRAAYDRRSYWRLVHGMSDYALARDMAGDNPGAHFMCLARTELAFRNSGRFIPEESRPRLLAADHREYARKRAASISRKAEQAWRESDLAAYEARRAARAGSR
jgi:hypothetical protein